MKDFSEKGVRFSLSRDLPIESKKIFESFSQEGVNKCRFRGLPMRGSKKYEVISFKYPDKSSPFLRISRSKKIFDCFGQRAILSPLIGEEHKKEQAAKFNFL